MLEASMQVPLLEPLLRLVAAYAVTEEIGDYVILQVVPGEAFKMGRVVEISVIDIRFVGDRTMYKIDMINVPLIYSVLHRDLPSHNGYFGSEAEMTKILPTLNF
jgi:hypothetical protein